MQLTIQGVIVDGSLPLVAAPSPSPVTIPMGVDCTILVPIVGSNGKAITLTGYAAPTLTIKNSAGAVIASGTIVGTISGSQLSFQVPGATLKTAGAGAFRWDVFLTNPSSLRDEPVPDSALTIAVADGA